MMRNVIASLGVIAFVASFWLQRDYSGLSSLFIDPVMIIVFACGVLLFAWSLVRGVVYIDAVSPPQHIRVVRSFIAFLILVLWVLGITRVGFILSSFFGVLALSFLLQTERATVRSALLTVAIAALVSVLMYIVFHSFLYVQLPNGVITQFLFK